MRSLTLSSVNDASIANFRGFEQKFWEKVEKSSLNEQLLPFSVQIVQSAEELEEAINIRQSAYGRHLPELAQKLGRPEAADFEPGSVVFLAKSKLDDSALGTARLQTNEFAPLPMEASVELPTRFTSTRLCEVSRLGVQTGSIGRAVKVALVKALFEYCEATGIEYAMLAARSPVDRQYAQLMFEDVFPESGFIPMRHAANLPHRVMHFEIATGEQRWAAARHPLLAYFRQTFHPDIRIDRDVTPAQLEQIWLDEQAEPMLRMA